jgi:hypothetical protein
LEFFAIQSFLLREVLTKELLSDPKLVAKTLKIFLVFAVLEKYLIRKHQLKAIS